MSGQPDSIDRALIVATQGGLPLVPRPYEAIAAAIGTTAVDVMSRLARMTAEGVIRRTGIVVNHYALGLVHNAMTVWDVADDDIVRLGKEIGRLDFVSHCYHRPRRLPDWPYNLFAMVHGTTREEVTDKTSTIERMLGASCRAHDILVSTRILKKTGLRIKS